MHAVRNYYNHTSVWLKTTKLQIYILSLTDEDDLLEPGAVVQIPIASAPLGAIDTHRLPSTYFAEPNATRMKIVVLHVVF